MRAFQALAALALLAPAFAAKTLPPPPPSYVLNEGVIPDHAAAALGRQLADVERRSGRQLVVALFQSLEGESLEDYVHRLFQSWRIGSAKKDDGVLFALFLQERRWRVEVGYGLEPVLTDLEAAEMARAGVPYFKEGDYARGVSAVVDRLAARLTGEAPRRPSNEGRPYSSGEKGFFALVILIIVAWVVLNIWLHERFGVTIGGGRGYRSGGWGGGGGGGWGGGGGFSGGGGRSGGGGASGGW